MINVRIERRTPPPLHLSADTAGELAVLLLIRFKDQGRFF